jgi:hypothetical protein
MPKSEELDRENKEYIIYHGHIHVLSKNDVNQENKPFIDKEIHEL